MGLDMYARRRVYVKQWDHQKPEERFTVRIERGGKPVAGIQSDRISAIEEDVMYWRKANHIHGWFVDNVQNGIDDQRTYLVDWADLRKLLNRCERVIEASKLVERPAQAAVLSKGHSEPVERSEPGRVIEDATTAKRLLPTREGFFFGSYEYDEEYLNDVVQTRDWAKSMIADHENGVPGDIGYSSWW